MIEEKREEKKKGNGEEIENATKQKRKAIPINSEKKTTKNEQWCRGRRRLHDRLVVYLLLYRLSELQTIKTLSSSLGARALKKNKSNASIIHITNLCTYLPGMTCTWYYQYVRISMCFAYQTAKKVAANMLYVAAFLEGGSTAHAYTAQ